MQESDSFQSRIQTQIHRFAVSLRHFPWRNTARVLSERFREDRLGLSASSLTFTTLIALVPLLTLALAIFTAFPTFATLQNNLQTWLVQSLVPDQIGRSVMTYLTQFSSKASRLGGAALIGFIFTALALILTMDRTLNQIWRVPRLRPLPQRVLIYWALLTLGPLLLAAIASVSTYAYAVTRGFGVWMAGLRLALDALQFIALTAAMAALFHYVPNTKVKWSHAWVGSIFVGIGFEIAKYLLTIYLRSVPTFSAVYGAFASLPLLLLWIYMAWLVVLLGAVVTAYLPSLLAGVARRGGTPGWDFTLAFEVIAALSLAKQSDTKGLTISQLAQSLKVDDLQLTQPLAALESLDWIGRLSIHQHEAARRVQEERWVLLVDPDTTLLMPLASKLLLKPSKSLDFWPQIGILNRQNLRGQLLKE